MDSPVKSICLGAAALVAASGALARLGAQVAAKSPFVPAATPGAAAGPTAGAPLEFRGYLEAGQGVHYRLYDPAKKAGTWVRLNERNADFDVVAKTHDDAQKTLTIEHRGRTLTLAMRESKVVSSGQAAAMVPPAQPMPMPVAQPNVSTAVTQSVVLNPTPADEQRRLEAVAAEVARRRALREQAAQQLGPGNQPVPPPPPLPPFPGGPASAAGPIKQIK